MAKNLVGWVYDTVLSKYGLRVRDSSNVDRTIIDEDGAVYPSGQKIASTVTGTIRSELKITPSASATVSGITSKHILLDVGDETGNTAYGMGDPAVATTGIMGSFGRTAVATGTQTDTGLDIRVINKLTNTGVNTLQGAYIKAKNYSGATVGALIGLFVEVVSDGTVTNGGLGIKIGSDGTVPVADMMFSNGQCLFCSALAITANSTLTSLPAGSIGITSHATGRGKLFTSDGSKWQFMAVA